jgi:hypothetical protein
MTPDWLDPRAGISVGTDVGREAGTVSNDTADADAADRAW